ncbi:hypothetical protein [Actinomadura sp. 3N508]
MVPDPGPADTEKIFEEVFGQPAERIDWLAAIATATPAEPATTS